MVTITLNLGWLDRAPCPLQSQALEVNGNTVLPVDEEQRPVLTLAAVAGPNAVGGSYQSADTKASVRHRLLITATKPNPRPIYLASLRPRRGLGKKALKWLMLLGVLSVGLILPPVDAANDEPPRQDGREARELMRRAVARDETLRRGRANLLHDEEIVTEQVDAQGQRVSTRTEQRRRVREQGHNSSAGSLRADAGSKQLSKKEREAGSFQATVDLGKIADRFELRREPDGMVIVCRF